MILRMLKMDLSRGRVVNATLLLFILLSALLTSTAAALAVELTGAMDALFRASSAPHFVQMHAGEIDREAIASFAGEQAVVTDWQVVEMINIGGGSLYLNSGISEAASVMENAFVTQNETFDFLLDLENRAISLEPGEIAVPIYHMRNNGLQTGDLVRVEQGEFRREYRIAAFVRDVQMNPSLVTSKRYLLHHSDWLELKANLGESEYLIEFQLTDPGLAGEFEQVYQQSGLPQKDTAITWSLYRLLSALTDGIVIGVILLIELLLTAIALLCLRFSILATMEGDYREIGAMKAIGLPMKAIGGLYLAKYTALAGAACILGYLLSLPLCRALSANITLYMGRAEPSPARALLPAAGSALVFLLIWCFCRLMLGKFRRISAVQALRVDGAGETKGPSRRFGLSRSRGNVNVFLGVRDVLGHPGRYGVLCLVFVMCFFLMVFPLNLYTTVASPQFTTYMGAGRSDIRIDLARTQEVGGEYRQLLEALEQDVDVERYAALVTAAYKAENGAGNWENIKVETGDFSVFPLEYLEGDTPKAGEIALSVMQAQELEKNVGDEVALLVAGEVRQMTVCGVYQDVTNGGKTAKALLPWEEGDVLWYIVNLDVGPDGDLSEIIRRYGERFPNARVMDMEEYLAQTMGGTIGQLRLAAALAFLTAVFVAVCITALFFRMLLAKDAREIAIMGGLGFAKGDISLQYSARSLLVLLAGVLLGTLAAGTLGQALAGGLGSFVGASGIRLVVNPLLAWGVYPLALLAAVTATTMVCSKYAGNTAGLRSII